MSTPALCDVIIQRNVGIPMRDGVRLAADFYWPASDGRPMSGPMPVVLQRTPYGRLGFESQCSHFARHGYLSVVQDCRGRFDSEGDFRPLIDEPMDGYDTIAWLAKHPASNGRVGMYGCSYMAWVQFQAATQNPPALKTMIPYEGPINAYHYSMRNGGALHLGLLQWVIAVAQTSPEARAHPEIAKALQTMAGGTEFLNWASRIPWRRGQTPLSLVPRYEDAAFELYFEHPDYDEFWRQPGLGMSEYFQNFPDIPILWVVGWYDWYPRTIIDGYKKMRALGRRNQHLLVGPWTHNNFNRTCGDVDFGPDGQIHSYDDYLEVERRWFDRWLKEDSSAEIGAPARIFIMGGGDGRRDADGFLRHGGAWSDAPVWPPAQAKAAPFYLHADGKLAATPPPVEQASTAYIHDPRNSVSSNGRCIINYGPASNSGFSGMGPRDQIELPTLPGHGIPGMPLASRPDVLVFQTPPLEADLRIAGDVKAVLWISSDAPDTDFFVKLLDVHPSTTDDPTGYALPVSEGILRARFREGFDRPALLEPGQVYRIEFPLEPAANRFKAGHRIRVDICSSNFPNFDINPNTGDPHGRTWRLARNAIHHDKTRPSYIEVAVWEE